MRSLSLVFPLILSLSAVSLAGGPDDGPESSGSDKPSMTQPMGRDGGSEAYCLAIDDIVISRGSEAEPVSILGQLDETNSKFQKGLRSLVAASVATFASSAVTYPLSLTTIRRQVDSDHRGNLYKGFKPYSLAMWSSVAVGLFCYDSFREAGHSPMMAGTGSIFLANLLSNPLWVLRTRMGLASNESPYTTHRYFQDIKARRGILMSGFGASLGSLGPHAAFFPLYEEIVRWTQYSLGEDTLRKNQMIVDASSALGARLGVSVVAFPFETLRVIQQKNDGLSYETIVRDLLAEGGVRRFWRGFSVGTARSGVGTAIYMAVHQQLKRIFESGTDKD